MIKEGERKLKKRRGKREIENIIKPCNYIKRREERDKAYD